MRQALCCPKLFESRDLNSLIGNESVDDDEIIGQNVHVVYMGKGKAFDDSTIHFNYPKDYVNRPIFHDQ